jgi:HAD superfamily hydrolase (TIGR01484 family)
MIKAIFFDIDGTLVSFETHEVIPSAREALKKLKEKGIRLYIATGRAKDGLKVLEGIDFDGYITLNGQYCFASDGTVIYENTIARHDLEILVGELEKNPFRPAL